MLSLSTGVPQSLREIQRSTDRCQLQFCIVNFLHGLITAYREIHKPF